MPISGCGWGHGWSGLFFFCFVLFCFFLCSCNPPSAPVSCRTLCLGNSHRVLFVCLFVCFCFCFCFCFWFCFVLFCFLLYVISSGIPPHTSLRDEDAGPAFLTEHGHLGTMGEQCCACLPRLVNKNE